VHLQINVTYVRDCP